MGSSSNTLRKAAIILSTLPNGQAASLMRSLEPGQAAAVAGETERLRAVDADEREAVVLEFAAAQAQQLGQPTPPDSEPFEFLFDLETEDLWSLIADEQPQTIAMILSFLPPHQAAELLAQLEPQDQIALIRRVAGSGEPSPEVIGDVELAIRRKLAGTATQPTAERGVVGVVKMLNAMDPVAERQLLGELSQSDPQLLLDIRRAMFGYDVPAIEPIAPMQAAG